LLSPQALREEKPVAAMSPLVIPAKAGIHLKLLLGRTGYDKQPDGFRDSPE
jgi:hypothetical protein